MSRSTPRYVELQCASHFSFLRGASPCEELFSQAAVCGIEALAITDRNSLAGIVRAHEAVKATGVRPIVGCRLELTDGAVVLVYPTNCPAYGRLCRLLTIGKARAGKGEAARRSGVKRTSESSRHPLPLPRHNARRCDVRGPPLGWLPRLGRRIPNQSTSLRRRLFATSWRDAIFLQRRRLELRTATGRAQPCGVGAH